MTEHFEDEIQAFEKLDKKAPIQTGGKLFLGSSSIRLWSSLKDDFKGLNIINRGFGGSQIHDSIRFSNRIIIPYKPKRLIFYAGDNDLASEKTPEEVCADFRLLVKLVLSEFPNIIIIFISIKPSPARITLMNDICKTNLLIKEFIKSNTRLKFADVFESMLGPKGNPRPELFIEDNLHMNAKGYRIWKQILKPFILE